jgi:uncharacterized protein YjiS (DUF1127 family)
MRDYMLNHARSFEAAGPASLLGQFFRNLVARRSVAKLDRMDDFLLRDIGFTRDEIRWASGLPLSVNAAAALEERANSRRSGRRS